MSGRPELYLVAGSKPWNRRVYDEIIARYPGEWRFVSSPAELDSAVSPQMPRRIFFLHWSWIVPDSLVETCDCVCFHMTDVPYGRGGSPLQNLILRGHDHTRLSALKMTNVLDGGPVYEKRDLALNGTGEEVYLRATYLAADMIRSIIEDDPTPVPQSGEIVTFARRKPADSEIPELSSLSALHDFIRMLDAPDYPHAFVLAHGFRYELRHAALHDGRVEAEVIITQDTKR